MVSVTYGFLFSLYQNGEAKQAFINHALLELHYEKLNCSLRYLLILFKIFLYYCSPKKGLKEAYIIKNIILKGDNTKLFKDFKRIK